MPLDSEPFGEDEPLSYEHEASAPGSGQKLRENLLLFTGIAMVILATGMALSNFLS